MLKKLSFLFIVFGAVLVGWSGFEIWQSKQAQESALKEAQALVKQEQAFTAAEEKVTLESFQPVKGETIGILHIPALGAELPIVEGTNPDELAKGVGHYASSAFPKQHDQIVLSGHRDTVFRKMGDLKIGDTVTVELPYGSFTYIIENTEIVDADDTTVIRSTAPEEVLTLTTCYPFSYVGNAPKRYILYAKRN
ncbi:class D sortase [Bacillus taeanensis]|uniref:Class D sortase n=1 Tax=Bacillus taeanensis TaxID=273032 RepID=A0A366XTD6_9BACI|nr:class D sortase [Bacillus taeanensis]RBW68926.1 class D sortase [Bacillus taeanensis]